MVSGEMKRRHFLGISLAAASSSWLPGISRAGTRHTPASGGQRELPNFVILVADDTGWRDVGYHGSEIETPTLDRMAREGVALEQFYVWPTCSPTRASLLTGRPPSRFRILGPISGKSELALPKDVLTLPRLLKRAGYQSALIGKWHLGLRPEVGPGVYGFDYSYGYLHGQIDPYTHRYKFGDQTWHRNGEFVDEEGHATDLIAKEAVRYIRKLRDPSRPFLLYVAFSVPHVPLNEPEEWVSRYEGKIANRCRRLFAAATTHMDDAIRRILEALETEGLAGSTLVLFTSDNGGQRNWNPNRQYEGRYSACDVLGDNRPFRGWKGELYEGGIRVPAIAYWPGVLGPARVEEPVSAMDLLPTAARLAGVNISGSDKIEGIDVWPVLTGGRYYSVQRVFYWRTGRQMAVRVGDWKLVHHASDVSSEAKEELFNIAEDPYEQRDLSGANPNKQRELLEVLTEMSRLDPS